MRIAAVIPTRFQPLELRRLLNVLEADSVETVIVHDEATHDCGWSLYRLWNIGVRQAIDQGVDYIAILNDDITIKMNGVLRVMAEMLDSSPETGVVYPDMHRPMTWGEFWGPKTLTPTTGTWGAGGMTGFCFMFRADLGIPFDEGYCLWYGDDAFEEAVRAKGLLVCRIDGLPIDHTPGQSTAKLPPEEVAAMIAKDRQRWESRMHSTVQREPVTA